MKKILSNILAIKSFSILLVLILTLWHSTAEAALRTTSATKACGSQPICPTAVNTTSFTINYAQEITWRFTGSPSSTARKFLISTSPTGTPTEPELSSALSTSSNGTRNLLPGTYYIILNLSSVPNGTFEITYNDALSSTGEPHITTMNGARYDFQSVGEFTFLRQSSGLEIQVRQSPIATKTDRENVNASCVSINTAIAAKLGSHRVTYSPALREISDSKLKVYSENKSLELRVDGKVLEVSEQGIDLGNRNRITKTIAPGGIRLDFSDGSYFLVTPGWWESYQIWYLNLDFVPVSGEGYGIAGAIEQGTWLPLLPDKSSMGLQPQTVHERFVALNQKFADAWRVTDTNSLFDYASGTSTSTFTDKNWPSEDLLCNVPGVAPADPISENFAKILCQDVKGSEYDNCVYDVMLTGNPGFATTYTLSQRVLAIEANKKAEPVNETMTKLKWSLLGFLLGLLIAILIFLFWRKKTQP
jgi:hypothetical protein